MDVSIRREGTSLFFINLKNSLHFHSQNGSAVDFAERQEYLKVTLATFHHLYLSVRIVFRTVNLDSGSADPDPQEIFTDL